MPRLLTIGLLLVVFSSLIAFQPDPVSTPLTNPFAAGWMVADSNGDGIVDFVPGKIVVPAHPSAAENAAAADVAARIGFATTGFTPPIVISADEDRNDGPRIYIGRPSPVELQPEEGGVFAVGGNLLIAGHDDAGLLAAAQAFASRAPYLWRVPGEKLAAIEQVPGPRTRATGFTYLKGEAGINRAFLDAATVPTANLQTSTN